MKLLRLIARGFLWIAAIRPSSLNPFRLPILAWPLIAAYAFAIMSFFRGPILPIMRDMTMAVVSDKLAGPRVPFEFDTWRSRLFDPQDTWGLLVNSQYVLDRLVLWVPQFAYEGISDGIYPKITAIQPFAAERSFVVAGTTGRLESGYSQILLNERFLVEPWGLDERDVYITLLHELTHAQGGYFTWSNIPKVVPPGWPERESARLESLTSAATIEMTAAICNRGDKVACGAFWLAVKDFAMRSLHAKAYRGGFGWAYELFADVWIRDTQEQIARDKSMRFWAKRMWELQGITERYGEHPWEAEVIAGVCGKILNAGTLRFDGTVMGGKYIGTIGSVEFDDTRYALGIWGPFLRLFGCPE